jgi:hypothetical protein
MIVEVGAAIPVWWTLVFAGVLMALNSWALYEVWKLSSGQRTLIANVQQLTREEKAMDTNIIISEQALTDLQAADASLQTTVANVLAYISTTLGQMPTDDSSQVEAVVSDIQAKIAGLTAAITPAVVTPPAPTPTPTPTPTPDPTDPTDPNAPAS